MVIGTLFSTLAPSLVKGTVILAVVLAGSLFVRLVPHMLIAYTTLLCLHTSTRPEARIHRLAVLRTVLAHLQPTESSPRTEEASKLPVNPEKEQGPTQLTDR